MTCVHVGHPDMNVAPLDLHFQPHEHEDEVKGREHVDSAAVPPLPAAATCSVFQVAVSSALGVMRPSTGTTGGGVTQGQRIWRNVE